LAPDVIEFRLYADAGGSLGALLETINVQTVAENYDGAIETGFASNTTKLIQGESYWLMATSVNPTIWFNNESGAAQLPRLWTPDGVGAPLNSDTTDAAAFRLDSRPESVPTLGLPAVAVLAALVVLGGSRALRRGGRER
jgi:hypothetical protein